MALGAAEVVIYTPVLITALPLAPVIIPMTKSMAARNVKVNSIYQGMTKDELLFYLGEPRGKYQCFSMSGTMFESEKIIWEYSKEQVLPGTDLMFFKPGEQEVYHCTGKRGLARDTYWKRFWNCTQTKDNDPNY